MQECKAGIPHNNGAFGSSPSINEIGESPSNLDCEGGDMDSRQSSDQNSLNPGASNLATENQITVEKVKADDGQNGGRRALSNNNSKPMRKNAPGLTPDIVPESKEPLQAPVSIFQHLIDATALIEIFVTSFMAILILYLKKKWNVK